MRAAAPRPGARAPRRARTGAHFVTTFHNAYAAGTWLKRRYNSVMAAGERVIAISDFVARHAAATYGVPPERLRVVHRGIDIAALRSRSASRAERVIDLAREWRLPDGVPVVMLPGRLTRWKGHAVLIEALRRLGREALHCVIVGSGSERYRRELETALSRDPPPCSVVHPRRMPRHAGRLHAGRCRGLGLDRARGLRPRHRRGAGDGAAGHRHRAWRRGRDGDRRARPAGWCRRAMPTRSARRSPRRSRSTPAARLALARRAIAHARAFFGTARMTASTIAVYEELLDADAATAPTRGAVAA